MENLQGKILISTGQITQEPFKNSMILICEHTETNIMGIMINKNLELTQNELISQMEKDIHLSKFTQMVLDGGPLKKEQGFVLHQDIKSSPKKWRNSKLVNEFLTITTSRDIVEAIINERYQGNYMIALGYCGWDNQQLAAEINRNDWIVVPHDQEVIFQAKHQGKKKMLLRKMGIANLIQLGPTMGNA